MATEKILIINPSIKPQYIWFVTLISINRQAINFSKEQRCKKVHQRIDVGYSNTILSHFLLLRITSDSRMKPRFIRRFMYLLTSQGHSFSKMYPTIVGNYKRESVSYNVTEKDFE